MPEMILIYLLLIVASIVIVVFSILLFIRLRRKQYRKFVAINSRALRDLNEINGRYKFNYVNLKKYNFSHTYDNYKMYDNLRCYDYLVYKLQFIGSDVEKNIEKVNKNKIMYSRYIDEVNATLKKGVFLDEYKGLNYKKLIKFENEMLEEKTEKPVIEFRIAIELFYMNMAGRMLGQKSHVFTERVIEDVIDALNDKNGGFYNNRDVWDSICRVERGKVSNKMRFYIYDRDHYRCQKCGRRFKAEYLEIDHIIPIAKGGKTRMDNLQTLCHWCNVEKGDKWPY